MMDPFFFGYGSLVNRATHDYARAYRASVCGWRRAWRHTKLRKLAYLSAIPAPGETIDGLIAAVPGHDWARLDLRERAYLRHPVAGTVHPEAREVQIYAIAPEHSEPPDIRHPILLSYIDVVLQGYLREYGPAGADRFIATTDGWDAPVLDDRAAPIYPRHQRLSPNQQAYVDGQLAQLGAEILRHT